MTAQILYQVNVLAGLLVLLLLAGALADLWRRKRRTKIVRAVGFPLTWLPWLERGVAEYRRLPLDLREDLQHKAFAKMQDLTFAGIDSVEEVSEAMKLSLVGHLCLLHARLRIPPLPAIRQVVIGTREEAQTALDSPECPWTMSTLVVIWDDSLGAGRCAREEFDEEIRAHWRQLRDPALPGRAADALLYAGWARSLRHDAADRLSDVESHSADLVRDEALFAAASEAFIRCPDHLHKHHRALYEGLKFFYLFAPARWLEAADTRRDRYELARAH